MGRGTKQKVKCNIVDSEVLDGGEGYHMHWNQCINILFLERPTPGSGKTVLRTLDGPSPANSVNLLRFTDSHKFCTASCAGGVETVNPNGQR